jgi:uncharacterized membrane-anchored protein
MHVVPRLLWLAAAVQIVMAASNIFLPELLRYQENLSRVSPIIRQMFLTHVIYLVGIVLLFAAITAVFSSELASGRGLGRFLSAAIACFWLFRVPVQLFYYDANLRKTNRLGDFAYSAAAAFLSMAYGAAALAPSL